MAEQSLSEKLGATPGKLILVGALGVTLLGVVASQFLGGNAGDLAASAPLRPARRLPRPITGRQPGGEAPPTEIAALRSWPAVSLAQALLHDPFAQPAIPSSSGPSAQAAPAAQSASPMRPARREALERLHELRAAAVAITRNGPVATVGTNVIRVGDQIEGFRVTNIDLMGITLVDEESGAQAQ